MSLFTPLKKIILLSACFIVLSSGTGMSQIPTNCGCDDMYDPQTQPNELTLCLMNCDDADIPVDGNLWLLFVAGIGIVIFKNKIASKLKFTTNS